MKNLTLVAVLAIFGTLAFSSCKKDHTCTCKVTDNIGAGTDTTWTIEYKDTKKKDAKKQCDQIETTYQAFGMGIVNADCSL